MAVHFLFNGWYVCSRYPTKLGSMAFQIHGHGGFTYTIPHKSGLPYSRSTASPGLPIFEFALCSFPMVDLRLPAIYYLQAQPLAVPCWGIIHLGYWVVLYYFYRDVYY